MVSLADERALRENRRYVGGNSDKHIHHIAPSKPPIWWSYNSKSTGRYIYRKDGSQIYESLWSLFAVSANANKKKRRRKLRITNTSHSTPKHIVSDWVHRRLRSRFPQIYIFIQIQYLCCTIHIFSQCGVLLSTHRTHKHIPHPFYFVVHIHIIRKKILTYKYSSAQFSLREPTVYPDWMASYSNTGVRRCMWVITCQIGQLNIDTNT